MAMDNPAAPLETACSLRRRRRSGRPPARCEKEGRHKARKRRHHETPRHPRRRIGLFRNPVTPSGLRGHSGTLAQASVLVRGSGSWFRREGISDQSESQPTVNASRDLARGDALETAKRSGRLGRRPRIACQRAKRGKECEFVHSAQSCSRARVPQLSSWSFFRPSPPGAAEAFKPWRRTTRSLT